MRSTANAIRLKSLALAGAAALLAFTMPTARAQAPAEAKPPELKLTVALGPAFALGRAGERWAELVTERAQGKFTVKAFPGATLARRDAAQELRVLQAGGAELAAGSALAWSDRVPALGVIALPWLAPTAPELDAVLADASVRARLAEAMAAQGAVLVALAPLGHRLLATTRQGVRSPADLEGLRVRVPTTALVNETYIALGAKPAVMAFAEAQAALAAGTLDAQDAPATALVAARVWGNGLVHATQWGAFADAIVFAVRREVWEGWPEALRVAAREAAEQAAREATAPAREDTAIADLAQNGVVVLRLTPAGRAAFRTAVESVYARWTPAIGAALVAAAGNASRRAPVAAPAPGPAK